MCVCVGGGGGGEWRRDHIVSLLSLHPIGMSRPNVHEIVSVRYLLKRSVYWIHILYTCM